MLQWFTEGHNEGAVGSQFFKRSQSRDIHIIFGGLSCRSLRRSQRNNFAHVVYEERAELFIFTLLPGLDAVLFIMAAPKWLPDDFL